MLQKSTTPLLDLVQTPSDLRRLETSQLRQLADELRQEMIAAVDGAAGGFGSGIAMFRAQWVANGHSAAQANVANFGDGTVDSNASGWPVGTGGNATIDDADACVEVWTGVMQNPPTVDSAAGSDYLASAAGQVCTYAYQGDSAGRSVAYNASSGALTVTNP